MAEVLACKYRYVTKKDDKLVRVVLGPGDKVEGMDKKVVDDLRKRKLIVDEKRLTEDGVRIPYGVPDREVKSESKDESDEEAPKAQTQTKGTDKK